MEKIDINKFFFEKFKIIDSDPENIIILMSS